MKKICFTPLLLAAVSLFLFSCSSSYPPMQRNFSPVHTLYEKAGTLGKGRVELAGSYTNNRDLSSHFGEAESLIEQNFGLRAGYGVTDKFDLKLRYEFSTIPTYKYTSDRRLWVQKKRDYFFALVPKLSLQKQKFSLLFPVSFCNYRESQAYDNYSFGQTSIGLAVHAIRTFELKPRHIDLSTSVNAGIFYSKGDYGFLFNSGHGGFNLGLGFSSDLQKWAVRPEIGYKFRPTDERGVWNFGVGFQVLLFSVKK